MIHHIKRATRRLIFWSLLATAISLTAIRLLLMSIDNYKTEVAAQVSELMGAPVTIGRLRTKMRGFSPELVLTDIAVSATGSAQKTAIALKEIRLGMNLLDLLVSRKLLSSSWVTLIGAKLSVLHKADGGFAIIGLKAGGEQPLWLLQGGKYEVLQSEITWQDEQTAARPVKVDAVDLALINNGDQHRINAMMQLPEQYGGAVRLSMVLTGDVFAASAIDGAVFAEGRQLNFARLMAGYLPGGITVGSGKGDIKLWASLRQSQLIELRGETQLREVQLQHPRQDELAIKRLQTDFHWQSHDTLAQPDNAQQWRLDVNQFLLETAGATKQAGKSWPDAAFSIAAYGQDAKPPRRLGLAIRQIDLQEASSLAQFFAPLPDEQLKLLAQAQLQGNLRNFSIYADLEQNIAAVNGQFQQLKFSPVQQMPGVENLTGQITGNQQRGVLRLATDDARLNYPELFREALVINRLEGALAWRQDQGGWMLSSPLFELDLLNIKSKNRLRLTLPKNSAERPFLDLQMALSGDDVSQIKHYFPTKVMKQADIDWLDVAFIKGRINRGGVLYYGPLGPLHSAVFEAVLDVDQVELHYAPDWPNITDLAGRVLFLQNTMVCEARQGRSHNLNVIQATAINTAVGVSKQLQLKGEIEGQVPDALGFLQQTPLNKDVGALINAINTEGTTKTTLDIDLAISKGGYTKVDGSAQLNQAKLQVKAVDLWLHKINGALKFDEHGVYSDTIDAVALNHPVKINIDNTGTKTNVNITGRAAIDDLKKQFEMPIWNVVDGALDYQLKLALPLDNGAPELQVRSDLAGVALDLPGVLAKTKPQAKPLSLTFSLGDEALLPIAISYDEKLKAAIKLDVRTQGIHSGHILLGPGTASQPSGKGLTLEINQDPLELHDLLGFSAFQSQSATDGGADIKKIHIRSQHALWKNSPLGALDLALKPEGDDWVGNLNSAVAQGEIRIPANADRASQISLALDTLDLSALKQLTTENQPPAATPSATPSPLEPEKLPLFTLTSRKTMWQSVDLGLLNIQTERIPGGLAFKKAELQGMEQQLTLSGEWKNAAGKTTTTLQGYLEIPNAEQLLSRLGITKEFKETSGHVNFSLNWNAPPHDFALADLYGQIDVNLKEGRIVSIEPGFGRVLGILAMAQWTKRLQLDFRDIYQEGLMFNTIKGHFEVLNGKAVTNNLIVDAIPAKITITGDTDFVSKTVDQTVVVTPKSADAVPIAGTIMGNVMSLVSQTLTGEEHEGFLLGSQYHVKGPWDNMEIIPLHENDGLLQKTWAGITDFPWLQKPEK